MAYFFVKKICKYLIFLMIILNFVICCQYCFSSSDSCILFLLNQFPDNKQYCYVYSIINSKESFGWITISATSLALWLLMIMTSHDSRAFTSLFHLHPELHRDSICLNDGGCNAKLLHSHLSRFHFFGRLILWFGGGKRAFTSIILKSRTYFFSSFNWISFSAFHIFS